MRRAIGAFVLLPVVALLLVACVSKGTYQNVVAERDGLKAQLTTLQADLSKSQSDLATAQTSLASATKERDELNAQLTTLQADLSKRQSDLATAQTSLASTSKERDELKLQLNTTNTKATQAQKYLNVAEASLRLVAASLTGSAAAALETLTQLGAAANATGDQPLIDSLNNFAKAIGTPAESDAGSAFLKLMVQRLDENKF
jgi:chromosome segregation ATPase